MCNAYNHPPGCNCGFGRPGFRAQPRRALRLFVYQDSDLCRSTRCPECQAKVFFIRHNGGSLWVEELGWPWPKHEHFGDDDGQRVYDDFRSLINRTLMPGELPLAGECMLGRILKVVEHSGGRIYLVDVMDPSLRPESYVGQLLALAAPRYESSALSGLVSIEWRGDKMFIADQSGRKFPVANKKIGRQKLEELLSLPGEVLRPSSL